MTWKYGIGRTTTDDFIPRKILTLYLFEPKIGALTDCVQMVVAGPLDSSCTDPNTTLHHTAGSMSSNLFRVSV
jgi:hypothetical protein